MSSTCASTPRATGPTGMSSIPSLGPGSLVGGFRIESCVGHGGMGVVYAATQVSLGRQVALKVMTSRHANDPVMRARFAREARAQAALSSSYVVTVHDHGEHDGLPWIATQLVPGGDLASALRDHGTPSLDVALDLVEQVSIGVADAHASGLVHRDIKPANVLISHAGPGLRAWVADFGIARVTDSDLTDTAGVLGTAAYMAPELHHGVEASRASDVYALGCLLWSVLVGAAPYSWSTGDYQLMTAHICAPVPALAGDSALVDSLNGVLARAMAKDPAQRFASAEAFRVAVRAIRTTAW